MLQTSFYTNEELANIGFKSLGEDVLVSRFARIYSPEKISIGNKVRIDDFCVISGNIIIHNYIHIAAGCLLAGGEDGIVFEDYTGMSSRSAIYAASDDYSGRFFTNPMLPDKYRHVISGKVIVKKHAIIGSGCTILPGVVIGEGVAVGSMSLINKSLDDWGICVGIPCKRIKDRDKGVLELEKNFLMTRPEIGLQFLKTNVNKIQDNNEKSRTLHNCRPISGRGGVNSCKSIIYNNIRRMAA